MEKHKHYEAAYRAHYSTSFSPEKRAASECQYFEEQLKELEELGANEEGKAKFERLFLLSLSAKSRCMSSMITGPAKFPFARNQKNLDREMKVTQEMFDFVERLKKAIDKEKHPEKYASTAIRSDDENAIDKLKEKLAKLQKAQEQMKSCNKIIKDKKDNKIERLAEILGTKERAEELLEPDFCGRVGFAGCYLTNNNAAIKTAQERIIALERMEKVEEKEEEINGVKVIQNKEEMRLQLIFDGKPAQEMINLLKSKGFKWSPRFGAWQRLLNENCLNAFNYYIKPKLV